MPLTAEGWTTRTVEEITEDLVTKQNAAVGALLESGEVLDTTEESVLGRINGTFVSVVRSIEELIGGAYDARDPDKAMDDALDGVLAIRGTRRRAASKGSVELLMSVAANTTLPAGLIAHVAGQPDNRWVTRTTTVNSTGIVADVAVMADAENTGPISAITGSINVIATPYTGWLGVNSLSDAVPGKDTETNAEFRLRSRTELASIGTSPLDAIRANLLRENDVRAFLPDGESIDEVRMNENVSDYPDADGLPGHSVEAIVRCSDDAVQAVGEVLWRSRAGGIETWSLNDPMTEVTVVDDTGVDRVMRFTRVEDVDVWLEIDLVEGENYPGETAVKEALVAWGDANLTAGVKVKRVAIECVVLDVDGVEDVIAVRLGLTEFPTQSANLPIDIRHRARLDTARILITSTPP